MPEHRVKRKLRQEILPYVVSADLLKKTWYYRLYLFYNYWGDMLAGAAALGIGHPLLQAFLPPNSKNQETTLSLASVTEGYSTWFLVLGILAALIWLSIKTVFIREDGQKRAVLAKSCCGSLKHVELNLHMILINPDPMPDLNKITLNQVQPLIDRTLQDGGWPWAGPAPNIEEEIEKKLKALCNKYECNWEDAPQLDLLRKEAA